LEAVNNWWSMARPTRINLKLVTAIICMLAGVIILWRTFGDTPASVVQNPTQEASVATEEPTRRANAELATPMPTLTPVAETGGYPIPATDIVPNSPTIVVEPPSPTLIVPTAVGVVATTIATEQPTTSVAATNVRPTQPGATPTATPQPTLTSQIVPTSVPATVVVPVTVVVSATVGPTSTPPTVAATATATPTSTTAPIPPTSTPTSTTVGAATPTNTSTKPSVVTVTYQIESSAPVNLILSYTDATGKFIPTEISPPWTTSFTADPEADLVIDTNTDTDVGIIVTCKILVDGKVIVTDTANSYPRVRCERLAN
jgi:hypothetical protein